MASVKKKNPSPAIKRDESVTLTKVDQCYIENNGNLSPEKLAQDLGKPVEIIIPYFEMLARKHNAKSETRVQKLLNKDNKKGYVAMTGEASMVGDDARHKKIVTLDSINEAIENEDYEKAEKLKAIYNEQRTKERKASQDFFKGKIHYIKDPDEYEDD